jgi:redox-sensitive bicupin YhaK (pirin superfamily)
VINDDVVVGGRGFGSHPHDNMEIISIPLSGDLAHKDSNGNEKVIKSGDIQVMSAGTGIVHSEYNANTDKEVNFLQIWVFPNERNVAPRYQQKTISFDKSHNNFLTLLSPNRDAEDSVWIHQNAWFSLATIDANTAVQYQKNDTNNGTYIFVLEGDAVVRDEKLNTKDAIMFDDLEDFSVTSQNHPAKVLILEVPMNF